jgi:8-oxo-dGTP diphosphatase
MRGPRGNPPWTFPAGKIESGESPEHAAVRETWDETGLPIRTGDVIGSRIHPLTGVPIAYVAATPTSALDVIGGRAAASGRAVRGSYCLPRCFRRCINCVQAPLWLIDS